LNTFSMLLAFTSFPLKAMVLSFYGVSEILYILFIHSSFPTLLLSE
jgi:hypothetical protein